MIGQRRSGPFTLRLHTSLPLPSHLRYFTTLITSPALQVACAKCNPIESQLLPPHIELATRSSDAPCLPQPGVDQLLTNNSTLHQSPPPNQTRHAQSRPPAPETRHPLPRAPILPLAPATPSLSGLRRATAHSPPRPNAIAGSAAPHTARISCLVYMFRRHSAPVCSPHFAAPLPFEPYTVRSCMVPGPRCVGLAFARRKRGLHHRVRKPLTDTTCRPNRHGVYSSLGEFVAFSLAEPCFFFIPASLG